MNRSLKYASESLNNLNQNGKHNFAKQHALNIYEGNSIYTFIPKNACSTMRVSLAIKNGCIKDIENYNWIHKNNGTFSTSLSGLITAKYTFVILRDPFKRLVSVYLDKIVERNPDAWNLLDTIARKIKIHDLTFEKFVKIICKAGVFRSNIHWRPQVDFLVYEKYDNYFAIENFAEAIIEIEQKTNMKIFDARNLTRHGLDQYELIKDQNFSNTSLLEILRLKQDGYAPSYETLYTEELIAIVKKQYQEDFNLYIDKFGEKNILFKVEGEK